MRIITSEAIFSSSDPELYTMPVRTATRQIYHSVSTSLDTRIDIDAMIESINFDYQRVYSELVQDPVFHCRIPAPPDFPLRNRKIELPQSLEYAKVAAESTLLDHENKIIFSADKRFSADQFYHSPVFAPVYGNIFMSRHSLPMPASKVWKKIDLNHKQFRINIPDGIETLYRHLLWTFSTKRQQPATFSSSSLVKVNKLPSAFSTGQPSFATTTSFRDRTRLITKLTQNFFRDSIKVSKLRMKDILSLARQASEKFSQVNNQLRA